jgi:hypothetical protein
MVVHRIKLHFRVDGILNAAMIRYKIDSGCRISIAVDVAIAFDLRGYLDPFDRPEPKRPSLVKAR